MTIEFNQVLDTEPNSSEANVLPLPVSVFEQYMLIDDRSTHPMAGFLEIDLSGPVDPDQLQAALPIALKRHPLLNSIVQSDRQKTLQWVAAPQPVTLELLAESDPLPNQPAMDLRVQPGLRVWLRPTPAGANFILYVHHATCDALGMLTFSMEWLAIAAGTGSRLPPVDAELLRQREDLSGVKASFSIRQRLRNASKILLGKPCSSLAIPQETPDQKPCPPDTAYRSIGLSREETVLLRKRAKASQSSLNDWLAASLFLTLQNWDEEFTSTPAGWPWRVLIPVNRRTASASLLSACNCVGYKILTQTRRDAASFSTLLTNVRREMNLVRRSPQGVYSFLKLLQLFSRLGLLRLVVRRYDNVATAILSNLGDLNQYFSRWLDDREGKLHAGPLTIEAIRCAPPRRKNTHVTIVALSYAGQLQLVSSRLGRGLNDARTLQFLERYRETILKVEG